MNDYISRHASVYPPRTWTFLADRPRKVSHPCNEIWTEMTTRYEETIARRCHIQISNRLSKTVTGKNLGKLRPGVRCEYDRQRTMPCEKISAIRGFLMKEGDFVKRLDELCRFPLESTPEEEKSDETTNPSPCEWIERQMLRKKQAETTARDFVRLRYSNDVENSFRSRLDEIYFAYYDFICTPAGKYTGARWAQLCRMAKEVAEHVARVRPQLASDVVQLKEFLRGMLFDQYGLMRATPMEEKDPKWIRYGECIILGEQGNPRVEDRLARMIDTAGLDQQWVLEHLESYYDGNDHIGQWQRYAHCCRWEKLAEKLSIDMGQLQIINGSNPNGGRRCCRIISNIRDTRRQYFKRLDGARDYELSEYALKMDMEYEDSSSASTASSSTISFLALMDDS